MLTRKTKSLIMGATGLVAAVSVVSAIAIPASKTSNFEVQYFESGAALPSLNHVVRADTALSPVYGFFMEGILTSQFPQAMLGLADDYQKRGYKNYVPYTIAGKEMEDTKKPFTKSKYMQFSNVAFDDESSFNSKTGDSKLDKNGDSFSVVKGASSDLYSPGVTDILEVNAPTGKSVSFRARVNPDAGWSNGDKILASDFLATIKYMLDIKTASLGAQVLYETLHLRGAKEIIKNQTEKGMTIDQAWALAEKNNQVPARVEGTDNRWIHYFLDNGTTFTTIIPYLAGSQFMPVNEKFVESVGGIKKYGQTKETILSDGPYKISSMDLDYMVTFERNEYYFQPEMVLLDHPGYKVAPSTAIQLKLFEDGKLSSMDIAPEFLASIYKKPKLIPLLQHGGSTPATQGIKFSKYYADMDKNSPTNFKDFRKAIMYAVDRNRYASYTNQSGSSPANSIFAPRAKTVVEDENGQNYYDGLINSKYKEYDPSTGKAGLENLGFDGYDSMTKYSVAFSQQHNHDYKDYLYDKELANHYLDSYLKQVHKTQESFKIDITSSEENNFLAIKNILSETFGNKISFDSHLVSSQVMSDEVLNGKFQSMFATLATNIDDPWTLYSKVLIEDGYKDAAKHTPYTQSLDKDGNPVTSMQTTSRYWSIPGFTLENAIDDIENEVDGEDKTAALARMDISSDEWDSIKKAVIESQEEIEPTVIDHAPTYKYGIATQMSKITSENINGFTKDEGDADYEKSVNLLAPYVRKDGTQSSEKIFKQKSELFKFYTGVEKLMRDSSWFVPTLTNTSGWFIDRRGLRAYGTQEGMPYGYRNIYPKDNTQLIDAIENRIKEKYGVTIVLERA